MQYWLQQQGDWWGLAGPNKKPANENSKKDRSKNDKTWIYNQLKTLHTYKHD